MRAGHRDADPGLPLIRRSARLIAFAARYIALRRRIARKLSSEPLDVLLSSLDAPGTAPGAGLEDVRRAIQWGERVARRAPLDADTCLYRALARYALLRASGFSVTFVMGVDPEDLDAGHAWVELGGAPLLEARLPSQLRTFEHPPRA